jgi:hypothetical protein
MPLYMTLAGEFGYGRPNTTSFNYVDLISFSNWHMSNASTITSNIPNFHFYDYDGSVSTINDGGYSMWNIGNFVSLNGFVNASTIVYGTLSNTPNSNYGYFVSQPNVWPQVELAYVRAGTMTWNNAGKPGTGGSINSSNANSSGSYTTSNQGRYGSYWVNQNYGMTYPTICYLWFTIQQSNMNPTITSSNDQRNTANPPYANYTQSFSITGYNVLFGQMLLSVVDFGVYPHGYLIPDSNINAFITNYVQNASINIF